MHKPIILAISLMLTASAGALAKGPFQEMKVGNWWGGAYTNDRTGAFDHCAASATYGPSGQEALFVSMDGNGNWSISVLIPNWNYKIGTIVPFQVYMDGVGPFYSDGRSLSR